MSKENNKKTVDYLKKNHSVPDEVKAHVKEFIKMKKIILKTLESEHKTIPQISKETNIPIHIITKNLMTLIKYGNIKAGEMDETDEYYFYEFIKK